MRQTPQTKRRQPRRARILMAGGALAAALAAVAVLAACGDARPAVTVDLTVHPARLDDAPGTEPPAGWQRVVAGDGLRGGGVTYLVADEPLLTGWNITAFRAAELSEGGHAIAVRLNAAGQQKMADFVADEARLKAPLGLRVDGRWADFSPLLRPPGDRLTLYGLTAEEIDRLEAWLEVR